MLKYVARRLLQAILVPLGLFIIVFWSDALMIILFAGILHLLPLGGRIDPMLAPVGGPGLFLLGTLLSGDLEAFGNAVQHIIMPVPG